MPWSISDLRVKLAPWKRFRPFSKMFNWPFQGGTSLWIFYGFFLSCVCYAFVSACLFVPCGHLLREGGWPLDSPLCHFPHWYPGSGVVLDCIDSWSLRTHMQILKSLMRFCVAQTPLSFCLLLISELYRKCQMIKARCKTIYQPIRKCSVMKTLTRQCVAQTSLSFCLLHL